MERTYQRKSAGAARILRETNDVTLWNSIINLKYGSDNEAGRAANYMFRIAVSPNTSFNDEYLIAEALFDVMKEGSRFGRSRGEAAGMLASSILSAGTDSMCDKATNLLARLLDSEQLHRQDLKVFSDAFNSCSPKRKSRIRSHLIALKNNPDSTKKLALNLEFAIFLSRKRQGPLY